MASSADHNWFEGRKVAIVGGDLREVEVARRAAAAGAVVHSYGIPSPTDEFRAITSAPSARDAVRGADYVLLPLPPMSDGRRVYAPLAASPIVPTAEMLDAVNRHAVIVTGRADAELTQTCADANLRLVEYEGDPQLKVQLGPAIAEGALAVAVDAIGITLHGARACVVGFGGIGSVLTRTLLALGADVCVVARNPIQRAEAVSLGATATSLEGFADAARTFQLVFSTVPVPVVGREILKRLPPGTLVIELASPPGGVDLELARDLGHYAVLARGLPGRFSPVTAGRYQWDCINRKLEAVESAATALTQQ